MTKRTRYFIFGSIAFLLVGLCAGLVAYYSGLPIGAFGQSDTPAELSYVPGDAALVAYADVREVMQSQLRQKFLATRPEGHEDGQEEFQKATGIDIERDIDHVVAFLVPTGREKQPYTGMVLASGTFDVVRLEGLARDHGGQLEQYKGKRLISRAFTHGEGEQPAGPSMTVAFLETGLVAVGDTASVRRAIDGIGGQNITGNAELMNLVGDIDDSNAWAVGRFDALMSHAKLPEGVANQIPAIRWFSASGRVNGGVSGLLRAEARDEQAAQNLRDVVQGFLALGRLQASNQPEIQALVSSLQVSGTGKTVALSFSMPAEVVDALAAIAGHQKNGED